MKKTKKTTPRCGHFFQADVAMVFKCGFPLGHAGSHGNCNQDVLAYARDVTAERVPTPSSKIASAADLGVHAGSTGE